MWTCWPPGVMSNLTVSETSQRLERDGVLPSEFVFLQRRYGYSFKPECIAVEGLRKIESSCWDEQIDVSYSGNHFELDSLRKVN